MLTLAIDTSTAQVAVAIGDGAAVRGEVRLVGERRHAEQLAPAIQSLCQWTGVELGQLTVISIAFLLIGLPFRNKPWYRQRIVIPGSVLIAAIGLFWFVQRVRS